MRSVVYSENGPSSVLRLVERELDSPAPGEVRVRVSRSGVNPADWKVRAGFLFPPSGDVVPNLDGSGTIDKLGDGVVRFKVGDRVWVSSEFALPRGGTAQEFVVLPVERVFRLPDDVDFDLGASLGVPTFTAHRALSSIAGLEHIYPGALAGATVLVSGGAGAVGHAAIQLGRYAGAKIIATVSSPEKVTLAERAGADHVINYRVSGAADLIRDAAPGGVDGIVEVAIGSNANLDRASLKLGGTVAIYSNDGAGDTAPDLLSFMQLNARFQLIALPALPREYFERAAQDLWTAMDRLRVGEVNGLPLHHFSLADTAAAHDAVASGVVGRVLVDVAD